MEIQFDKDPVKISSPNYNRFFFPNLLHYQPILYYCKHPFSVFLLQRTTRLFQKDNNGNYFV